MVLRVTGLKRLLSLLTVAAVFPVALAASPRSPLPDTVQDTSQSGTAAAPVPQRLAVATDHDSNLVIPRLPHGPTLEDFLNMQPEGDVAPRMAKVSGFVQQTPHDGEAVSQPTEAYLGYDEKNLYVVFVCHDDPAKVRGHETRREDFDGDDDVAIMLDTFHDLSLIHI